MPSSGYNPVTKAPAAFSDRYLKSLKPKPGERIRCSDAACSGLFVLVGSRGAVFHAKAGEGTVKIGPYPQWTIEEARRRVAEIKMVVANGEDPRARRGDDLPTVAQAFEWWQGAVLTKRAEKTRKGREQQFRDFILPSIGKTRIDKVTRADVLAIHGKVTTGSGPVAANRAIEGLSALYGALNSAGTYIGANPCARLEPNREFPREVYLTSEQAGAVLAALDEFAMNRSGNDVTAQAVKFCLATGCRSGEAKAARWADFNETLTVWTKPARSMKARRMHRVPLGPAATAILKARRIEADAEAEFVFHSKLRAGHIKSLDGAWGYVRKVTGLEAAVVHDLRHSFASLAVSAGVPLKVVGGLLGHSSSKTTDRYAHLYDDDLKNAAIAINARLKRDVK